MTLVDIFDFVIYVCGAYQIFLSFFHFFIAFLNSLGQEEYMVQKKKHSMLGSTFLCPKVWLFPGFSHQDDKMTNHDPVMVMWRTFSICHDKLQFQLRWDVSNYVINDVHNCMFLCFWSITIVEQYKSRQKWQTCQQPTGCATWGHMQSNWWYSAWWWVVK